MQSAATSPRNNFILWILLLALPSSAPMAQTASDSAARREAIAFLCSDHALFDFLIGDWKFAGVRRSATGSPQPIGGVWSAVKSSDGPMVTDEFRIVDQAGRTAYVSTTVRVLSLVEKRWNLIGIEPYTGVPQRGTAWKDGTDIRIDQVFASGGSGAIWRIRYYNIRQDSFSWRADRSLDSGKTWVERHMTMEAVRIGPARQPESLTKSALSLQVPSCG